MSDAKPAAAPSQSGGSKLPLILALVNTVVVLAGLGTLVYTRVLYKKPPITEDGAREELEKKLAASAKKAKAVKALIKFEPMTVNIKATQSSAPQAAGAPPAPSKMHYVNVGFFLEIRDSDDESLIADIKPKFLDKLLQTLGNMNYEELTTVQGRYILRTKIVNLINQLANAGQKNADPVATQVYFTDFVVQ
ncbi:MAG: flagellar basal body-associated FliL family protein [Methylotenera sp.]|nr:flagellar basal body-associated FliL family protein [Oligoflexia bacterium]